MRLPTVWLVMMLAFVILTAPCAANAQPSTKVHQIGFLWPGNPPSAQGVWPNFEAFQQGLRDLGYLEGQNLAIEHRYAEHNVARLSDLAAELVRLPVDVLVTVGTLATRAAKHATGTIPIVMTQVGADPVASGLVASLAQPGGNVTGVTALGTELWEKRLALLTEAVPRLARLAVLLTPAPPDTSCLSDVTPAALAMGLQVYPLEVRDVHAFEHAFAAIAQEPPDALLICWSPLTANHARLIADLAVRHRLPTLAAIRQYVQAGALLSYGTNIPGQMRRAADYVEKMLKGTKPADLPVERSTQFELVLNLQTAQALGLTLPPTLLFQATEVIR